MSIEKDAKELAQKFTKYRRLQERRVKLMKQAMEAPEKKAKNVDYKKKVIAQLAEINAMLKEMDVISARIIAALPMSKKVKAQIENAVKGPDKKLIN